MDFDPLRQADRALRNWVARAKTEILYESNTAMSDYNTKPKGEDDGTLAFLGIPQDENNKQFNCSETTQQKLINLSFFVLDFIDGVKTKSGNERFLVKIKHPDNSPDKPGKVEKFFTNSTEIKYVLREIKKRNAFPRKVTMRASGTRYYFE